MWVHCGVFGKSFKRSLLVHFVLSVSDGLMSQTPNDSQSHSSCSRGWKLPEEGHLFLYFCVINVNVPFVRVEPILLFLFF